MHQCQILGNYNLVGEIQGKTSYLNLKSIIFSIYSMKANKCGPPSALISSSVTVRSISLMDSPSAFISSRATFSSSVREDYFEHG